MKEFGGCSFLLLYSPFGFTKMIVFNKKSCDFLQLLDTIKVCLAHWYHGKWPSILASINDFFLNPAFIFTNDILFIPSRLASSDVAAIGGGLRDQRGIF